MKLHEYVTNIKLSGIRNNEYRDKVNELASRNRDIKMLISFMHAELFTVTDDVIALVNSTDIVSLPDNIPKSIYQFRGIVFESREDILVEDVQSIGVKVCDQVLDGQTNECVLFLKSVENRTLAIFYTWEEFKELFKNKDTQIQTVVSFVVKLALLLEAEGSPIVQSEPQNYSPLPRKKGEPAQSTIRYIKLSNRPNVIIEDRTPRTEPGEPLDKTGMIAEKVHVRGHLKMQACGPKNSERKLIYVAPYTSTAWRNVNRETRISA